MPRGSVAVMTAIVLPVMFIMFTFVLVMGYLYDARSRLNAAGNCLASTYAEQALLLPWQLWRQTPDVDGIGVANGVPKGSFALAKVTAYQEAGPGARLNVPDAWAPAILQVDTTFGNPTGPLAGLSSAFLGRSVGTINERNSARLSQLHLGTFTMLRERVMFVLDYSKSMRLKYQSEDGQGGADTGLDVMQETGSDVIRNFAGVFDAGVLLFSDGETGDTVEKGLAGSTKAQAQGSSTDQNAHVNELAGVVGTTGTMGDGTDLAAAILRAQQLLNQASTDESARYSSQRMIIITDGEPDVGSGIQRGGDYLQRVRQAEAAADTQMDLAKQQGTFAQVVYMRRHQPDALVQQTAEDWLKKLGGTKDPDSKNDTQKNFHTDAKDRGELRSWLKQQPAYPYCISAQLDGGELTPPVPNAVLPGAGETLKAYFDMSNAGFAGEQQVSTVLYGPASENLAAWESATHKIGAIITTPGTANVDLKNLQDPNNLVVWYNTDTHRLYLSPWMCAAVSSAQNQGQRMRVRLRWGSPRPVLPGEEAIDVRGYLGI